MMLTLTGRKVDLVNITIFGQRTRILALGHIGSAPRPRMDSTNEVFGPEDVAAIPETKLVRVENKEAKKNKPLTAGLDFSYALLLMAAPILIRFRNLDIQYFTMLAMLAGAMAPYERGSNLVLQNRG
jgi:hypothetical protein